MTRITTPFGFASTADEVAAGIDLTGRRAVVTGGASGIGIETARTLAHAGAEVTLAVRDVGAGKRVAAGIGGNVLVAHVDLADRRTVADFVAGWDGPLHILVNNAGVMAMPEQHTSEGWEMQFATNHVGHFALTVGLYPALRAAGRARIVSVSSSGHKHSPVIFDDLHFAFRPYDPGLAYGQSKTANVLLAVEATRRWAADGITANAVMPGAIRTNLQRHNTSVLNTAVEWKTPQQGAATSVLLAVSPLLDGVGGRYFEDCNEAELLHARGDRLLHGVAAYALDPANASRLWQVTEQMLSAHPVAGTGR
ncbi:SDR family NAD(P)-dependent oxidoreductase [Kutzneria chonburiensis]|uniref:SDR family NAD(P)-dependent oxidoreductase n=1 Tax=Kutzneria chonburiensis TaxID=1483604 RepID=A0ABV6MT32_9PSEU|nr:SDR family NAD(P)-dependent oxidoreductase [Kutzneria chonburiensis]